MTGGMDELKVPPGKPEFPSRAGDYLVHLDLFKPDPVPVGSREGRIPAFDEWDILNMRHEPAAGFLLNLAGGPDMIHVAVGQNQGVDFVGVESGRVDIIPDPGPARPGAQSAAVPTRLQPVDALHLSQGAAFQNLISADIPIPELQRSKFRQILNSGGHIGRWR